MDMILDLCGGSGSWSRYYKQAGYDVLVATLPEYDVTQCKMFIDSDIKYIQWNNHEAIDVMTITGILAAPPCTEFSVLNCIAAARVRDEESGMKIVNACLDIIKFVQPAWWALENPVGYLRNYLGRGKLIFQPWEYGDAWTKRTEIWGNFTIPKKLYNKWEDVPNKLNLYTRPNRGKPSIAYLHKSELSKIPQLSWATPKTDADFRAITPPGFAKAFFECNK